MSGVVGQIVLVAGLKHDTKKSLPFVLSGGGVSDHLETSHMVGGMEP